MAIEITREHKVDWLAMHLRTAVRLEEAASRGSLDWIAARSCQRMIAAMLDDYQERPRVLRLVPSAEIA